jgi:glycosyltransferase involved in cell wall biosynthesis
LGDGTNAMLFPGGDAGALADAISRFMRRGDAGRALAEHSIERLQEEQSMDTFCQQIESLFTSGRN